MIYLIEWFQINYPELKRDMQKCQHNFNEKDINPYHMEGDCWTHTMMVCKIAEIKNYSKVVKISALLHDIGKPKSRKVNPKNNHVQFFGHEKLSAKIAKPLVDDLVSKDIISKEESRRVLRLVESHGILYRSSIEELYKKFADELDFLKELIELIYCDNMGRFASSVNEFALELDSILKEISLKIEAKSDDKIPPHRS